MKRKIISKEYIVQVYDEIKWKTSSYLGRKTKALFLSLYSAKQQAKHLEEGGIVKSNIRIIETAHNILKF